LRTAWLAAEQQRGGIIEPRLAKKCHDVPVRTLNHMMSQSNSLSRDEMKPALAERLRLVLIADADGRKMRGDPPRDYPGISKTKDLLKGLE
jgi:hypothetical protein